MVPTSSLAVLPEPIDTTVAAALPLAGLTALRLLRASGPLAGSRVLVTGASGGVGHYVTELASAAGAAVTVLTESPERAERLLSLGALAAVCDIQEARGPFDVVLESVGGDSLPGALRLLVPHGKLIWFGQASRKPVELDFFSYFAQTGVTIRHFSYEDSEVPDGVDLGDPRPSRCDRSPAPRVGCDRRLVANRRHDRGPARATDPRKRRADDFHEHTQPNTKDKQGARDDHSTR